MLFIRIAKNKDLPQIVDIYNMAVPSKTSTGDTVIFKPEEKIGWFKKHTTEKYPIYVAENDGEIMGWISLSPYRPGRSAFAHTAEISYYVHNKYHRQGVASKLLKHTINQCALLDINTMLAYIMEHNTASIKLLEKFAFQKWAFLPNIANFDGEEFNHTIYGKRINVV